MKATVERLRRSGSRSRARATRATRAPGPGPERARDGVARRIGEANLDATRGDARESGAKCHASETGRRQSPSLFVR